MTYLKLGKKSKDLIVEIKNLKTKLQSHENRAKFNFSQIP
jgi:hypothetical protein